MRCTDCLPLLSQMLSNSRSDYSWDLNGHLRMANWDGIEERDGHLDEFAVSNSMQSRHSIRARDAVQFTNTVASTMLSFNIYSSRWFLNNTPKSASDYLAMQNISLDRQPNHNRIEFALKSLTNDVECVRSITLPPNCFAGGNVTPIQCRINMKNWPYAWWR